MKKYGIITEATGTWIRMLTESPSPGKPLLYETKEEAAYAAYSMGVVKFKVEEYISKEL